jgi:hypothetical protein
MYKGSILRLLSTLYPDYDWLPWKFDDCPLQFWTDPKNQKKFIDWAAVELNIKTTSDWYNVSIQVTASYLFQVEISDFARPWSRSTYR